MKWFQVDAENAYLGITIGVQLGLSATITSLSHLLLFLYCA